MYENIYLLIVILFKNSVKNNWIFELLLIALLWALCKKLFRDSINKNNDIDWLMGWW
jgi:hypothetical protein